MFGSRRCFNGGAFPRLRTRCGGVPKGESEEGQVHQAGKDLVWEVLVLGYFWKNGRPKFKYIIIEKEVECKKDMPISATVAKL